MRWQQGKNAEALKGNVGFTKGGEEKAWMPLRGKAVPEARRSNRAGAAHSNVGDEMMAWGTRL